MNPFAKFGSLFDRFRKNRIAASDSMPIAVPNPIVAESPLPIGTGTPFLVRQTSLTHLAATQTTENTLMEMVLRDAAIYACAQDEVGRDEDRLSGKAIVRFFRINLTVSEPLRSQDLHQTLIFKVPCELILCSIRVPAKEMVVWQIHFAMPDCLRMKHTTPPPTGKHRSPFVISPLPRSVTLDFGTSGRCYTIQFLEIDERDGFLASTSGRMVFGGLIDADRTEQVEFGMDAVDCCEGEWRVVKDHVSG